MLKFSSVLAFVALLVVSALLLFAAETEARQYPKWNTLSSSYSYEQYLKDSNKPAPADPLEYSKREKLFLASLKEVLRHNAKPGVSYKKGINKFSDWTREEFRRVNGGRATKMDKAKAEIRAKPYHSVHAVGAPRASPYPVAWDWRDFKPQVISAVKNQGQCGSCFAHAATETLESHYAIATGDLFVLSQQQITSCSTNPNQCGGTGGCGGGIAELVFQYVVENGGITEEWQYPYSSYYGETGKCAVPPQSNVVAKFSGFKTVASNDANAVMDAVMNAGPLAVNVDASNWNDYESGIYSGCNYANNISIDHVVQLVGWGYDAALDNAYWTIRNSWSASYGEEGYIRILRQPGNEQCGWNVNAQDGTACAGQPTIQWTCGQCGVLFDTSYPIPVVPSQ